MDSIKKYEELKESGYLPKQKTALSVLEQKLINQCKYVKREGESCKANNNCKYPDCSPIEISTHIKKEKHAG